MLCRVRIWVILSWEWMWEEWKEHFAESCTCIVSVVYIVYYFKTVTYLSILQAVSYHDVNVRVTVSILLCMSEYAWKWMKGESRVHFAKLWYVQLVLSKYSLLRVFCYFANIDFYPVSKYIYLMVLSMTIK